MPQSIDWDAWLNGGIPSGYTVVGMQALYDTVRAPPLLADAQFTPNAPGLVVQAALIAGP